MADAAGPTACTSRMAQKLSDDSDREELIIGRRYDMRDYVRLILPPMLTLP